MNKCLNCEKETRNKYCNTACQNKHQNSERANKRYGNFKMFIVECNCCQKKIEVSEREKLYPQKEKYYCSISCANKRDHTEETKNKISSSLTKTTKERNILIDKHCVFCRKLFNSRRKNQILCSHSCSTSYKNKTLGLASIAGKKSAEVQGETRRSKNEKYFAELCNSYFVNVETNKPIFNGWDADVIIHDIKTAVLWNGNWHFKKITKKHSVKQVQNRDEIKKGEIIKFGYIPFVIEDRGKFNKTFVEEKFEEFKKENPII